MPSPFQLTTLLIFVLLGDERRVGGMILLIELQEGKVKKLRMYKN